MKTPANGSVGPDGLAAALRELQAKGASGVLRVARDGPERRIYFRQGRIVAVASDAEEDDLGHVLVERGRLVPSDLDLALRAMEKTGKPLPDVLSDLALLTTPEIDTTATELERSILSSVLSWPDGEIQFEETLDLGAQPRPRLDLKPSDVVPEPPSAEMPTALAGVVRWVRNPPTPFAETTLSTRESALLDLLRAPSSQGLTPTQIVEKSPLDDEETLRVLSSLVAAGVIEVNDPVDKVDGSGSALAPSLTLSSGIPRKLGRFDVERPLGRGSMGAVLLARDPAIDRPVAIKLIQTAGHLSEAQLDKYRERFYREASAAGQLVHPAIATVFDVGHAEDGTPFIVMEYVKGSTLRELLEKERLPRDAAMRIARDVLGALSFAHSQGIVHRDVKPTNVMVTPDFHAKIMDFGIAHVVGSELTSAEDVLGSPYYMAPEQLSKGPIGPATDLFSFAVVFYRMLTGVLPFTGESFAAIAHAILHEKPVPLERVDRSIPKALSRIVLRGLEKSPADRYPSAADVLRALDELESGRSPGTRPRGSSSRTRVLTAALVLVAATALALHFGLEMTIPPVPAAPRLEGTPSPIVEPLPPLDAPAPGLTPPVAVETASSPKPRKPAPPSASPAATDVAPRGDEMSEPLPLGTKEPTEAELFYEARILLERGEYEKSNAVLARLLERDPTFIGAAELSQEVSDRIWEASLPLVIEARHNHRIGGCTGELSFASLGIRFQSPAHDWAFLREDIRVVERPDVHTIFVETFEKDTLSFGKNKRYKFDLEAPFAESDWSRYLRLLK
jgi:serine/threonine-protein kinase